MKKQSEAEILASFIAACSMLLFDTKIVEKALRDRGELTDATLKVLNTTREYLELRSESLLIRWREVPQKIKARKGKK